MLRGAFPRAERRLAAGDIEILPHAAWYLSDGVFDLRRVIESSESKLAAALANG
jgi:hypothetical protein